MIISGKNIARKNKNKANKNTSAIKKVLVQVMFNLWKGI